LNLVTRGVTRGASVAQVSDAGVDAVAAAIALSLSSNGHLD
jgi:hypothetical protein